jgi:hypothetical protein
MTSKHDLAPWLVSALEALGGRGTIVDISRDIWRAHEAELRAGGDLFYTWQYDLRWAAYLLRRAGIMRTADNSPPGFWELS